MWLLLISAIVLGIVTLALIGRWKSHPSTDELGPRTPAVALGGYALVLLAIAVFTLPTTQPDGTGGRTVPGPPVNSTDPPPPPTIPDLFGLTKDEAKDDAETVGATIEVTRREISDEQPGTVIRQEPEATTLIDGEVTTIEVVLAIYPKVPKLKGLTRKEARAILEDAGLRLGYVNEIASTRPEGVIYRQSVDPGRRKPPDTAIRVTITNPHLCGYPLNPWCFSVLSGGSVIYNPPTDLCYYIDCISSFWSSTNGNVIQCGNGEFSHSGGVQGSCSSNGGNWRALYA